ncbi:MAG: serine aminopeptidase domain-containing protein [Bacteriovoracaceae bacterium]
MNYFLIPGNPPAVHFYELWQKEIMASDPKAEATVCSYPLLPKNSNSKKAIDDVLKYHEEQFNHFQQKVSSPVTIIGHSLGGNFALRLLNRNHKLIEKVILLHPFLRAPDIKGKIILKTVAALYPYENFQKNIIKKRKLLEYLSAELPHVSNDEIEKSFHLAYHEHKIIAPDKTPLMIDHEFRDKVSVFFKRQDIWCTDAVIKDLKRQVSLFECTEPHGFVTEEKYRNSLFLKIKLQLS